MSNMNINRDLYPKHIPVMVNRIERLNTEISQRELKEARFKVNIGGPMTDLLYDGYQNGVRIGPDSPWRLDEHKHVFYIRVEDDNGNTPSEYAESKGITEEYPISAYKVWCTVETQSQIDEKYTLELNALRESKQIHSLIIICTVDNKEVTFTFPFNTRQVVRNYDNRIIQKDIILFAGECMTHMYQLCHKCGLRLNWNIK